MATEVTEASFEADVLEHDQPVLVDFWASWCPPCKMMEPIVERLEQEYAGRARVVKVNIDRNPALAEQLQIQGAPTFIVFRGGEAAGRLTAAQTERKLLRQIGSMEPEEVIGIDNNESELFYLRESFSSRDDVHLYVGDVRERDQLMTRRGGVDIVVHAAAYKHVILCEHSPWSAVQNNILGTQNVIDAALTNEEEARRVVELEEHFVVAPALQALYDSVDYAYADVVTSEVHRPYNSAVGQAMTREELKGYLVEHGLLDSDRGVVTSD